MVITFTKLKFKFIFVFLTLRWTYDENLKMQRKIMKEIDKINTRRNVTLFSMIHHFNWEL